METLTRFDLVAISLYLLRGERYEWFSSDASQPEVSTFKRFCFSVNIYAQCGSIDKYLKCERRGLQYVIW